MAGNERFHDKKHRKNHHTNVTSGYPDSASDPIASPAEPFQGAFVVNGPLSTNAGISFLSANIPGDLYANRIYANTSLNTNLISSYSTEAIFSDNALTGHGDHTITFDFLSGAYFKGNVNVDSDVIIDGNIMIVGNVSALGDLSYFNTNFVTNSALSVNNAGMTPAATFNQIGNFPIARFESNGTLVVEISSQGLISNGIIYAAGNVTGTNVTVLQSTSANWDNVFTSVRQNSAAWLSAATIVIGNSANWNNVFTSVNANSSQWLSATTIVIGNSGNWNNVYTTVNANSVAWSAGGASEVPRLSTNWTNTWMSMTAMSSQWLSATTQVIGSSANWNNVFTAVYPNSSQWLSATTIVIGNSANWNNVFTSVRQNSAAWLSAATQVIGSSANWNNVFTAVYPNSSQWLSATTIVIGSSANWNNVWNTVNANSATWSAGGGGGVGTEIPKLSIVWTSSWMTVSGLSSQWLSATTQVQGNSGKWNDVYTTVNANSVTWGGNFTSLTSVNLTANNLNVKQVTETLLNPAIGGGMVNLFLSGGTVFGVTLNSSITSFNVFNSPPTGSFNLKLTQDSTGSRVVTFTFIGKTVRWANGVAPTVTTTANRGDWFSFVTVDGGASYDGFVAGQSF